MSPVQMNTASTAAQRRRSERVTDGVVAGYLNAISRRQHASGDPAAPVVRSRAAGDDGARIRGAGLRRPLRRRES
jgi:hypothetical protein